MYLYLFELIFLSMHFLLGTADILLSSSVLVVSILHFLLLTSVSSFFEFFRAVCLIISCIELLDARDISFAALRLSGERSHFVLVFPRVSFFEMSRGGVNQ